MYHVYNESDHSIQRKNINDEVAQIKYIESLRNMMKSWLNGYFPGISSAQHVHMAKKMDMFMLKE